MTKYDYDLFTIGAGSGGVRASRLAASYGAKVGVAEEYRVGGTCVIRGCVPKKLMVFASEDPAMVADARACGWDLNDPAFDWDAFRGCLALHTWQETHRIQLADVRPRVIQQEAEESAWPQFARHGKGKV